MTWTAEDDAPGRDEGGAARSVRVHRLRRTVASALLGALLLGTLGGLLGLTGDEPVGASALVQSSPDPNAVEEAAAGATTGDPAARNATYLETELVYLQGDQLAEQVTGEVGGAAPELEATRVGESNVIQITTTATSAETAVAQAQAAADLYVADRRARLNTRIAEQTEALEAQIAATDSAIAFLPRPTATGFDAQAQQRTALSTQYTDQLAARDALQRAAADISSVAGVIQSATEQPGSAVSTVVLLGLAGVLLGALLGAAVPALRSSFGGRVRDEKDVADLGAPLLSPALPRASRSGRQAGQLERAVQLQALALRGGPSSGGSVAFVAGTAGVGVSFAALEHARHAARYRPTLLVSVAGGGDDGLAAIGVDSSLRGLADLAPTSGSTVTPDAVVAAAQPTTVPNLRVLVAAPDEVAQVAAVVRALDGGLVSAATGAGWGVVVDTAPLDRSDIGLLAARQCAATVVVAGAKRSRTDEVENTLRVLSAAGVPVSGVVVTHPDRRARAGTAEPGTDVEPPASTPPATAPPAEDVTPPLRNDQTQAITPLAKDVAPRARNDQTQAIVPLAADGAPPAEDVDPPVGAPEDAPATTAGTASTRTRPPTARGGDARGGKPVRKTGPAGTGSTSVARAPRG